MVIEVIDERLCTVRSRLVSLRLRGCMRVIVKDVMEGDINDD